jgi:hypothetical protein
MAATDTHATTEELLEAVFSKLSMPRLYNEGLLPLENMTDPSSCQRAPHINKPATARQ